MARKRISPDAEIEALKREQEQLRNRMARAKARKLDELQAENRKAGNRMKVLVGVAVQQAVAAGELDQQQVDQWLDRYLTGADHEFVADQRKKAAEAAAEAAEGENETEATQPVAGDPQPAPEAAQAPRANEPATYQQFCAHYELDVDDADAQQQYQQYLANHPGH